MSKEVSRDLRKYKYNLGKTPNKENAPRRAVSAEKPSSPTKRLCFGSPNVASPTPAGGYSKELRELLKELDGGVHQKVALLKMLAVKSGEADTAFKKIR